MDNFMIAEFQHSVDMYNERLEEFENSIEKSFDKVFGETDIELMGLSFDHKSKILSLSLKNPEWYIIQYDRLHKFIRSLSIDFDHIDILLDTEDVGEKTQLDTPHLLLTILCKIE